MSETISCIAKFVPHPVTRAFIARVATHSLSGLLLCQSLHVTVAVSRVLMIHF